MSCHQSLISANGQETLSKKSRLNSLDPVWHWVLEPVLCHQYWIWWADLSIDYTHLEDATDELVISQKRREFNLGIDTFRITLID
jgi:hypothetical protein